MFKLAIDDVVEVPVRFTLRVKNVDKSMAFTLIAKRVSLDDYSDQSVAEFLRSNVTDWKDQKLVLDQDGSPAEFSDDAFDAMLKVPGVTGAVWNAYQREVGAKTKN